MTTKDRILRVFRKEPSDRIVWQPRLYYWYYGNGLQNSPPEGYQDDSSIKSFYENFPGYNGYVPEILKGKRMIDVYRALNVSPRYPEEILGIRLIDYEIGDSITVRTSYSGNGEKTIESITPVGTLTEVLRQGQHVEFPIKETDDFHVMEYLLEHTKLSFNHTAYEIAEREFGGDGVVTVMLPRSPLQRLIINYMGLETTVMMLHEHPDHTEGLMNAIGAWDDRMIEVVGKSSVRIANFGENIDANLISPRLFRKYHLPYYNRRIEQLHAEGIYCHIHMDGSLKPILPFIRDLHFDAIEAPTPVPQGDVTLRELKEALGEKILIDGIPALLFEPDYSLDELRETVEQLIELFAPNLILGVSDELPPTGNIDRISYVAELLDSRLN